MRDEPLVHLGRQWLLPPANNAACLDLAVDPVVRCPARIDEGRRGYHRHTPVLLEKARYDPGQNVPQFRVSGLVEWRFLPPGAGLVFLRVMLVVRADEAQFRIGLIPLNNFDLMLCVPNTYNLLSNH